MAFVVRMIKNKLAVSFLTPAYHAKRYIADCTETQRVSKLQQEW